MKTRLHKFFSGILIAVYISVMVLTGTASATPQQIDGAQFPSAKHEPRRGTNPETGRLSFIGGEHTIQLPGVSYAKGISPQLRALDMANVYGREFGLKDPLQELKLLRSKKDGNGKDVVHFQQEYMGVPILAGELIINLNEAGDLLSMSGEVSPDLTLDTRPSIKAEDARKTALDEIAKLHKVDEKGLLATQAELWIFDESLLTFSTRPLELVWRLEVTAKDATQPIRELVLVNAQMGNISFHVNQVDVVHQNTNAALPTLGISSTAHSSSTALALAWAGSRRTYTASGGVSLPGTFLCDENQSLCTNGTDVDADSAHHYAADTFVFYNVHHARNSFDNLGSAIISTVHYSLNYRNAFWNGSQMVYGDAMAVDDVVGHELTHGVTQYTSGLIYSYQSGAINESFSDVWGEFIDQTNGYGNDSPSVKWLIAEDSALGAIRSMSNPPAFGHPDKMSSPYYYTGSGDSGGVHINSGVNNKAAYLMVQGGSFNGKTITGIGLNKTAAVYYEVQLHHLTTGANYNDLYYALLQACQNLIGGTEDITQADCEQVKAAAEAVEMIPALPGTPNNTPTKTPTPSNTFTPTAIPPQANNPLYLSLTGNQTIGGVSSADEDILRFDGTTWSLFFDGSDVGVGGSDLFGFSFLDADSLLLLFNTALTLNGMSVTPRDVLRFDATSLGSNTAGTLSMYLSGIDVGLDVAAENIDSVGLLPDGRVLISTTGNPVVAGITGAKDEDVLAFTPTALGNNTSGTWAMYFDGSDVGLTETSGEDVDALDVLDGKIYLSTADNFTVNGVAGADEDVFICTPTSVGDVTACNYSPSLYFDGSTWGLTANDVDAFDLLSTTPVPTNTPSVTPSITPTPSRTLTPTISATPTRTPTSTMSPLPTNTSTRTNTPISQVLPDLMITAMRIELQNTSCLTPGDPLGVRVWVQNTGQSAAGSFVVNVNGAEQTINGLGIGETKVLFFAGASNPVIAIVDSTAMVVESNENNNIRSETLPIPTPPAPCATNTPTPIATFTPTITNTPNASDLIFADGFESGNLSAWTSNADDLGDLNVSPSAALTGTQGLQVVLDDNNTIYVTDDSPNAEPTYHARFYFDPNSILMVSGDAHFIFKGFMGTSTEVLRMEFRQSAGLYQLRISLLDDGTTWINSNWFTISDASHFIELDWRAATGVGSNNGSLTFWIDGAQQADLAGVDNDTRWIDRARLGALTGVDNGTRGNYFFDAFESRRQNYIGP